jgi:ABC-2 type transport system permease protein
MSTTTSTTTTTPPAFHHNPIGALRVSGSRVIRSEWIKLRSVRSTVITIVASMFAFVFFGTLFSISAGSGETRGPTGDFTSPVDIALGASTLVVVIVGVLGALFAASEYSSGLIKTTFASTGSRLAVLGAKTAVIAPTIFVTNLVAATMAFFVGQAAYTGDLATVSITDPGALRALIGTAAYHTGIAVIGVALGFLLRSSSGAIGVIVVTVFIAPALISFMPDSVSDSVLKYLPSEAGASMKTLEPAAGQLGSGAGFAVFAAWVVGVLALAAWQLQRRDA